MSDARNWPRRANELVYNFSMSLVRVLALWGAILATPALAAPPVIDANLFYFSDSFTYETDSSNSRMMWDIMVGIPISKKGRWVLGWNYDSLSFTDKPTTETTLTVTDMGPKLIYYFDKHKTWAVGLTYNLITKGTYTSGSTNTDLRGTSMKFEAGYLPMMWENVFIGAKINYYKPSFTEEVTNTTQLEQVSYSRTTIYPSFAFTFRFD